MMWVGFEPYSRHLVFDLADNHAQNIESKLKLSSVLPCGGESEAWLRYGWYENDKPADEGA
jgi:hypothetical protein